MEKEIDKFYKMVDLIILHDYANDWKELKVKCECD